MGDMADDYYHQELNKALKEDLVPDYDNRNSFILFFEADKKSEKSPDLTGTMEDVNGKVWRIAAWERVGKSGKNFFSGKISEVQPKESKGGAWDDARTKLKKDDVHEVGEGEIDLSSIPF